MLTLTDRFVNIHSSFIAAPFFRSEAFPPNKNRPSSIMFGCPKYSSSMASVIPGPVPAKAGIDREPRNYKERWHPGLIHWKVFAIILYVFPRRIMEYNLAKSHIAQRSGFQLELVLAKARDGMTPWKRLLTQHEHLSNLDLTLIKKLNPHTHSL